MSSKRLSTDRDESSNASVLNERLQILDNRYLCHCGKSYKRKQHLQRHQASHEGQLYRCNICGECYGRNDVLQRHVAAHEDTRRTRPQACKACHANKTKCDGKGTSQCSFCAARSIGCTYSTSPLRRRKTTERRNLKAGRRNETESAAINTAPTAVLQTVHMPLNPPIVYTNPTSSSPDHSALDEIDNLKWILQKLSMSSPKSDPIQDGETPDELKRWLQLCFKSYAAKFHYRWHIITAPTYDFSEKPLDNAASVIMIGSYFLDYIRWKNIVIDIHHCLVDSYFQLLTKPLKQNKLPDNARRLETYQAILMNIVFGMYLGDEEAVTRANKLCGLLITVLQSSDFFCETFSREIQEDDFPGTYVPWVEMVQDEWKRLIINLFKVDTQLSIICQQRPRLLDDELDATLPSTFALRNCYRIDIFLRRNQRERDTQNRSHIKLLWMMRNSHMFLPGSLLIEDTNIGLCSLFFEIFSQSRRRRIFSDIFNDELEETMRDGVLRRLSQWAKHLQAAANQLAADNIDHEIGTTDHFMEPYLGEEEETDQMSSWRLLVRRRVRTLIHEAMVLYHLLHILLSADHLRIIAHLIAKNLPRNRSINEQTRIRLRDESAEIKKWASSSEGRHGIIHSLAVLQTVDVMVRNSRQLDPIVYTAIAYSALIFAGLLNYIDTVCHCSEGEASIHLDAAAWEFDEDHISRSWVEHGGRASAKGIALCKCSSKAWIERFATYLPKTPAWEMAGIIAPMLQPLMHIADDSQ